MVRTREVRTVVFGIPSFTLLCISIGGDEKLISPAAPWNGGLNYADWPDWSLKWSSAAKAKRTFEHAVQIRSCTAETRFNTEYSRTGD